MPFRQSLSKVVGTHAVLRRESIYTVCYTQYRLPPPPPSPINVVFSIRIPILIKLDEQWHTTLNRGLGDRHLLKLKGFVASVPTHLKLIVGRFYPRTLT
jgi:hypothetical protein